MFKIHNDFNSTFLFLFMSLSLSLLLFSFLFLLSSNPKNQVLVATDVAARGLDMIVDLVLNAEPPSHQSGRVDTEAYVHRSGRTGRAGRKGICVTLYTPKQRGGLGEIGT